MKIEDIIKKNKDQLDRDEPPLEVWDGIKANWNAERNNKNGLFWKVAAAIFISTSIGLLAYTIMLQNRVDELLSLGDISEEYRLLEENYLSEIEILEASLPLEKIHNDESLSWMIDELNVMDDINKIYREDINEIPNDDQLINVLIDYYEKKIKLLRQLDLELKRTRKEQQDEKNTIDTVHI